MGKGKQAKKKESRNFVHRLPFLLSEIVSSFQPTKRIGYLDANAGEEKGEEKFLIQAKLT
jgi:hypothetical protein